MSSHPSEIHQNTFEPTPGVGAALFHPSAWKMTTPFMSYKDLVIELALLKLIKSSLENGLSLAETINVFAQETRFHTRNRIQLFATQLYHGQSLSRSMESSPNLFSPDAVLTFTLSESTSNIEPALSELIEQKERELKSTSRRLSTNVFYWSLILIYILFFVAFIWPTLKKLALEFYDQLPATMASVDRNLLSGSIIPSLISVWILIVVFVFLYRLCDIPRFRSHILSVPILHRPSQLKSRATTYQLVANALRQKTSIKDTLWFLANHRDSRNDRRPLQLATKAIDKGTQPWDAMNIAGLISRKELVYLQKVGQMPRNAGVAQAILFESKAKSTLSDIESRVNRRTIVFQMGALLFFGLIVFLISYSVFELLYSMIENISMPE